MSKRQYPSVAFTLTANFHVRKVTLTRPYSESSDAWGAYAKNKFYRARDLFATKKAAIKAGRSKIARRLKQITAIQNEISKQIEALNKAEKESA